MFVAVDGLAQVARFVVFRIWSRSKSGICWVLPKVSTGDLLAPVPVEIQRTEHIGGQQALPIPCMINLIP